MSLTVHGRPVRGYILAPLGSRPGSRERIELPLPKGATPVTAQLKSGIVQLNSEGNISFNAPLKPGDLIGSDNGEKLRVMIRV